MKATVSPQTLTDGSIVFDVLLDGEPVAHPPSQTEAEAIAGKINWLAGNRYVADLFRSNEPSAFYSTMRLPDGVVIGGEWPNVLITWPNGNSRNATKPEHDLWQALEKTNKEHKQNADFRHMFLATFAEAVNNDKPINGADAVDRICEFVKALQGKAIV